MKHNKTLLSLSVATILSGGLSSFSLAQSEKNFTLEEVFITAQRRTESAQDVPIAVTAISAEKMSELRIDNVRDIAIASPSVAFKESNTASASANIQIRGIGTVGNSRTFEGAVGTFIDGVYRTRSGAALSTFLDIESMQILRGPQGTLFGKNTSAGALLLNSTAPDLEALSGYVDVSLGNYNSRNFRGAINIPISDNVGLRIAADHTERDGFIDNTNGSTENDVDSDSIKATLLIEPNDNLAVKLIADYSKLEDDCCYGTTNDINGPLQGLMDSLTIANGLTPASLNAKDYEADINENVKNELTDNGLTLDVAYNVFDGELKSITAIRKFETEQIDADADFTGADVSSLNETFESEFFSQELTFNGSIDGSIAADYVIGLYYSDEDLSMNRDLFWGSQAQTFWDVVFGASAIPAGTANAPETLYSSELMEATAESKAIFTHWNFSLGSQFNLILGARYSEDEKTGAVTNPFFNDPVFDPLAIAGVMPGFPYDSSFSDEAISGSASIQWRPNDDTMIYFSYNRGYKAGGVNIDINAAGVPGSSLAPAPIQGDPNFDAETVDAYELGIKAEWVDGRARTNFSVFRTDIKDLQIAKFLGLQFAIFNSDEAKVRGAEIEQTLLLNDNLTLNFAATYLGTAEYGNDPLITNLSGREFSTAPELSGTLSLNFDYPIADGIQALGFLQTQHTGEIFTNTNNDHMQEAVTLINANFGVNFEDLDMLITAFVRNAADKSYIQQHFNTVFQDTDSNAYMGAPRTFGLSIRKNF